MSSCPNNVEAVAPWADLLPEVCDQVLDRLDAISILRFPAACTAWAAASKQRTPPRLPSGSPTLLTAGLDPDGDDIEYDLKAGAFGLHNIATGKSFYGEAQGLKNRTWIGGKDDWLVTTDMECGVELLNPVTGDTAPLPSFTTIEGLKASNWCGLRLVLNNETLRLQKIALCQTPDHPNGCLAVALFSIGCTGLVAFTSAAGSSDGGNRWTPLKKPEGVYSLTYTDVTVHNGKVLAVADSGEIYSWDMDGTGDAEAEPTLLPGPELGHVSQDLMCGFFLAASSGGRLQVVCIYGYGDGVDKRLSRRIVFKDQWSIVPRRATLHELDDAAAGTWRRVRDLGGDSALFVGDNYPFYAPVPPGGGGSKDLRADCVYVADVMGCDAAGFDLKLADEHIFDTKRPLLYPAMGDSLQMPMWFRPTAHPLFHKCP